MRKGRGGEGRLSVFRHPKSETIRRQEKAATVCQGWRKQSGSRNKMISDMQEMSRPCPIPAQQEYYYINNYS